MLLGSDNGILVCLQFSLTDFNAVTKTETWHTAEKMHHVICFWQEIMVFKRLNHCVIMGNLVYSNSVITKNNFTTKVCCQDEHKHYIEWISALNCNIQLVKKKNPMKQTISHMYYHSCNLICNLPTFLAMSVIVSVLKHPSKAITEVSLKVFFFFSSWKNQDCLSLWMSARTQQPLQQGGMQASLV